MSEGLDDKIDASLRRSFEPPDLGALEATIAAAAKTGAHVEKPKPSSGRVIWIAAVVLAAAAAVVFFVARGTDETPSVAPKPAADPELVARRDAGTHLASFYAGNRELPAADEGSCVVEPPPAACDGEPAEPRLPPTDALEVLGACGSLLGPTCEGTGIAAARALQLRLRPAGPDLLVCVEPRSADPRPLLPEGAQLNLYRREMGEFVLYEVSPLDESRALEHFSF